MQNLTDLQAGQSGVVAAFDTTANAALLQRLMQLGMVEGTPVTLVRRAPAGDPLEVVVMDYSLSLRAGEARAILIRDIR